MSLVPLADYVLAIGETDTSRNAYHQAALDAADVHVLNYTDRDFGAATVTETRNYLYDGKGTLDIDDASAVHTVTFENAAPLPSNRWRARAQGPSAGVAVFTWLELPALDLTRRDAGLSIGLMGFTQNLDTLALSGGAFPELSVAVNADYGWPAVPKDVQRAIIWTASHFESLAPSSGGGGELASKGVAEITESYFAEQIETAAGPAPEAIPSAARAILDLYTREALV